MAKQDIVMGFANIFIGGTAPTVPGGSTPLTVNSSGIPSTGGTPIGLTSDGAVFTYDPKLYDIKSQQAMAPVDTRVIEESVMLEFSVLEIIWANLQTFLIGSALVTDTTATPHTETVSGGGYGFITEQVITLVSPQISSTGSTIYHAICLYKGYMASKFELTYDRTKETVVKLQIGGHADTTRAQKDQLYQIYRQKPS